MFYRLDHRSVIVHRYDLYDTDHANQTIKSITIL